MNLLFIIGKLSTNLFKYLNDTLFEYANKLPFQNWMAGTYLVYTSSIQKLLQGSWRSVIQTGTAAL